jgi:hypothetical protein
MYWAMAAQAAAQFGTALFGGQQAPEVSTSTPFNPFTVDNSGWAVNFAGDGGAKATASPVSTLAQGLASAANNVTGGGSAGMDPLMIVLLAAVAIVALKKK